MEAAFSTAILFSYTRTEKDQEKYHGSMMRIKQSSEAQQEKQSLNSERTDLICSQKYAILILKYAFIIGREREQNGNLLESRK